MRRQRAHADRLTGRQPVAWQACDVTRATPHNAASIAPAVSCGRSLGLLCLGLALVLHCDLPDGPDAAAAEWAEVVGHALKDAAPAPADCTSAAAATPAAGAGVVTWALLSLLYRSQGASGWGRRGSLTPGLKLHALATARARACQRCLSLQARGPRRLQHAAATRRCCGAPRQPWQLQRTVTAAAVWAGAVPTAARLPATAVAALKQLHRRQPQRVQQGRLSSTLLRGSLR